MKAGGLWSEFYNEIKTIDVQNYDGVKEWVSAWDSTLFSVEEDVCL